MKHLYSAFLALLILGSAGLVTSAQADGYRFDPGCNCNRPVSSTRTVREAPRVVNHTRVVTSNRTVPRYRTVEENQLVVHVRPVIHKEVVVHREHVHIQNIVTKRINTINRFREEEVRGGVENRYARSTSESTVFRTVQGSNCNCGGFERVGAYREATYRY
ncbi:MAG: hypothetical protein JO205_05495 [Pseudolabrys sp.]|nr:hypothetical protein [Pseudolabrys sp.]MBV9260807.1 hypothetical protein [Pseudolabrys sp.]